MIKKVKRGLKIFKDFFKEEYSISCELYEMMNKSNKTGIRRFLEITRAKIKIIINGYLNPKSNFIHNFNLFVKEYGWGNL